MSYGDAILLAATAKVAGDDKYHLTLQDWHTLRRSLADGIETDYAVEISEWPDGLWSCTYGMSHTGPLVVDLGNMTLEEWFRRERVLSKAFWA